MVILHLQGQVAAAGLGVHAQGCLQIVLVQQLGSGVVEDHVEGPAVVHDVIAIVQPCLERVGDSGAGGQGLAIGSLAVPGLAVVGHDHGGDDHTVGVAEVGLGHVGTIQSMVDLAGDLVGDLDVQTLGITHHAEVDLINGICVGNCVVLLAGLAVAEVGVVAQLRVVGVDDGGMQAVVDGIVEDRCIGPVAVEADHGHGQGDTLDALIAFDDGVGIQVALDVDAVGELVQICLVVCGQGQSCIDGDGAVGGNSDLIGGLHLSLQAVGGVGDEILLVDGLGQDGTVEGVGQSLVGEVADLEGEVVNAGLAGVVAELDLGTGFGGGGVGQVCGGRGSVDQISQTSALSSGRVLQLSGSHQGLGGAHQQVSCQNTLCRAGDLGVVLVQVLDQNCHGAGDLGGSHGGTAHGAVVGTGQVGITGGVDVAADAGDLRLQLQVGGNAPGREGADGAVDIEGLGVGIADGHGTDAILTGGLDHVQAGGTVDGDTGDAAGAVIDLHLEQANGVVVNNDAGCAQGLGDLLLLGEGNDAAGDQSDLALNVQAFVVGCLANAGNNHVLQGLVTEVIDEDGGGSGGGVLEAQVLAVDGEVQQLVAVVVNGGDTQCCGVGSGGAGQTVVGVGDQVHVQTPCVLVGVVGVVAGCDQHLDVGIQEQSQSIQHFVVRIGEACGGTQGQVCCVNFQTDTVFQSCHNGGPACAAIGLEDLHHDHLCIGSNADDVGAVNLVCCSDTGDVGAVVVACVGVVNVEGACVIVEDEGQLGGQVGSVQLVGHLTCVQGGPDCLNGLTGHGIDQLVFAQSGEVGMVDTQAGVQDGDAHALTGIAGTVDDVSADHGGCVVGHGLCVLLDRQREDGGFVHGLDALDGFQLCLVAEGSGHSEAGGGDGVGVAQFKAGFLTESGLDCSLDCVQSLFLLGQVLLNGRSLCCDLADREELQLGLLLGDNDEGDQIVRIVHQCFCLIGEALSVSGLELGQAGVFECRFLCILGFFLRLGGEGDLFGRIAVLGGQADGAALTGSGGGCVRLNDRGNEAEHQGQCQKRCQKSFQVSFHGITSLNFLGRQCQIPSVVEKYANSKTIIQETKC